MNANTHELFQIYIDKELQILRKNEAIDKLTSALNDANTKITDLTMQIELLAQQNIEPNTTTLPFPQ